MPRAVDCRWYTAGCFDVNEQAGGWGGVQEEGGRGVAEVVQGLVSIQGVLSLSLVFQGFSQYSGPFQGFPTLFRLHDL